MGRSKSSRRWLEEHTTDHFVALAKKEGYRSRAVYKLAELDTKEQLFKPGDYVIELGASPGSWSQYISEKIGAHGQLLAIDILPMDTFANVHFIQGDFNDESTYQAIAGFSNERQADLVISDMAPNITGNSSLDAPRAIHLAELACELACETLNSPGTFLTKVFQGSGFNEYTKMLRGHFEKVKVHKPKASRQRSREVYIVARNPKL